MDMTHKPVLLLHICAGFNVQIAAARKCRYEDVSLVLLAGNTVIIRNSLSCPINLHSVSRLMSDAHCSFRHTCPAAVFVTELRTHVGLLAVCVGTLAVFIPKKSDGHTFLGQFAVNVLVVNDGIRRRVAVTFAVKQLIKHFVGRVIIERPRDVKLLSLFQHFADGVA